MMKSFTLIEVLVIIGIMVILMVLALPAYRSFQNESDLNNSTEEIINTLRMAQNKTLASEGASQYGVYFDTSIPYRVIMFKGENYNTRDSSFDRTNKLPDNIEIYAINLAGGESEVIFDRINGETSQSGNVGLRLINNPLKTKTIYIENSGQINLNSISPPSNGRLGDSQHVHFVYNQDVTTALTLHLIFPDYPADNYDILFQDYLNPAQTEFYWERIILVGPDGNKTEQKLKIHTHNIDGFTGYADFCVHRPLSSDQSYNDKSLNISLNGEELIRYAADAKGTITKGLSIWVEEPELQ